MKRKHPDETKGAVFRLLTPQVETTRKRIGNLLVATPNNPAMERKGMTFDVEGREYAFAPQQYGSLHKLVGSHQVAFYIEHEDQIVAFLMGTVSSADHASIDVVSVNPFYAGKGLCQMLVKAAAREFRHRGVHSVSIDNAGGMGGCMCYHKAMQPWYPELRLHPKKPLIHLTPGSEWSEIC